MREFADGGGAVWVASVRELAGSDYKGRYCFILTPAGGPAGGVEREPVGLVDVCWNSRDTAERTLGTMSESELQRRLRSALGRAA